MAEPEDTIYTYIARLHYVDLQSLRYLTKLEEKVIQPVLDNLVFEGILTVETHSKVPVYGLTRDEATRRPFLRKVLDINMPNYLKSSKNKD